MVTDICIKDVLLDSAKEVFEAMVFMPLEEAEGQTLDPTQFTLLGGITFTGDIEGGLNICCSITCSRVIAANMLCADSPEAVSDEDVSDAIGEIANMVLGSVKTRLQDNLKNMQISIPTVVQGRELLSRRNDGMTRVTVAVKLAQEYIATFSVLYRETGGAR